MAEFRMPALGADMESGTLTAWSVRPGDTVARGDIVASVETAKGIIDIEIFEAGVIEALLVEPGVDVAVGAPLATYRPARGEARAAARAGPAPAGRTRDEGASEGAPKRRAVSPAARRRARELGIDVEAVSGTGAMGAVTVADIERAAAQLAPAAVSGAAAASGPTPVSAPAAAPGPAPAQGPAAAAAAPERAGPQDMRAIIGRAMSRSKREIPHYYLATTIDMTRASHWLEGWNAAHSVPERLLPGALLLKATALALERFPELNGFFSDGRFAPSPEINLGVAIRLRQGGVIAPGIDAANTKSLEALMGDLKSLVQRARAGRLKRTEITNATITVSSLGEGGVETLFPIVYPPQVAIVGFGSIVQRPWIAAGKIVAAPLLTATLSADHRVSDGHRGSAFLKAIEERLQRPEDL